jgi:hypothetical protein
MTLKEIAKELGISEYPERLDEIYENKENLDYSFLDEKTLKEYNEEYNLFREFTDSVFRAASEIAKNEALSTYLVVVSEYVKTSPYPVGAVVPFPTVDLGLATDMMRLFPLLSMIPDWARRYTEHGFCDEEIVDIFKVIHISLTLSKAALGRDGYADGYFDWTLIYALCEMFDYGSFNFQFVKLASPIIMLKNKNTGKHVLMMTDRVFHKDGRVLGSPGFCDEEGSFSADFIETDEAYIGHTACDSLVSSEVSTFKKDEWECVLKDGDDMLSVHIPRNTDLSPEAIWKSYEGGMKMARERFPEYNPKYLHCASWIIDAQLEKLLGEKSRNVGFGKTFLRFPLRSKRGRDGFVFVFLGHRGPESELPEDTSLRRKIKELYLNGGYTYASGGIVADY